MSKIIEKVLEPSKINTGSIFLLKIKAIRYVTYDELRNKTNNDIKIFTYKSLKGE